MHDAKGRLLKPGARVLIPAVVTDVQASEDYCNVTLETPLKRRPDKQPERISGINTGVVLRCELEDVNDIPAAFATE